MRRLTLETRTFLLSFIPICILLIVAFLVIDGAIHQRVREDIREALHNSDQLLNRANADFSQENAALLAKLTDSAGLKASVGLLSEANENPSLQTQVRATIEAQLWELQKYSPYDFLAISDLQGKRVAEVPESRAEAVDDLPGSSQSGLTARQGVLFQVQSVPIEIGGESAGVLTFGRRFDLGRLAAGGEATLLKNRHIVLSTFPAAETRSLELQLAKNCLTPEYGCELAIRRESYVVSVLQREQLGGNYQLLVFRSLDGPLRVFNQAFLPVLVEVTLSGIIVALISTLVTARSVSRPLSSLASQLETGALSGTMPERLDPINGIREVNLVASAFNRVAAAERHSRSELILAKQTAETANRLKTEFLTNVSHELRTPLNGVLGMTELLTSTGLSEEQAEYAAIIRDSGQSLVALIDEILDFSELETGRLHLKPAKVDLAGLLDDVVTVTRAKAANKPILVELRRPESIPQDLIGDETRIRQALMHLCDNALKFTESGSICISAQYLPAGPLTGELTFAVEDTGIGIAPDDLDIVFQSFTQLDGSLTRQKGGTGIGLSITKAIVELMGGHIGVKSAPNIGSTFHFSVMVQLAQPAAQDSRVPEVLEVTT